MTIYVKMQWGFEHRTKSGHQFGASVGRDIEAVIGRALTKTEARSWRKHGIIAVSA